MVIDAKLTVTSSINTSAADVERSYDGFAAYHATQNDTRVALARPIVLTKSAYTKPTIVYTPFAAWLTLVCLLLFFVFCFCFLFFALSF